MQKKTLSTKTFRWNTACILELEYGSVDYRPDTDLWVFCLLDLNGNQIYRNDITDKNILNGSNHQIAIEITKMNGDQPVKYVLWPKLKDGTFTEKLVRPLPINFMVKYFALFEWIKSKTVPEKTVTCFIFGGLANQLFQIMTTVVFARQHGYTPIIYNDMEKSPSMVQDQDTYWDKIFPEVIKLGQGNRCNVKEQVVYPDPSFTYAPIPHNNKHMKLYGYFTSYKYLDPERNYILSLIDSSSGLTDEVDAAYKEIQQKIPAGHHPLVSVHIRRGDSLQNETLKKLSIDYYRQSMKHFNDVLFLVFSDDIPWCKKNLEHESLFFVENQKAYVDLLLMARCDHHIIANSTFSWWGAYLNKSKEKKVIYPYPWFVGEKASRDLSDFLYPEWIRYPA